MLDVFKLAQAINENAESFQESFDYNEDSIKFFGSIEEACGEANYIIACESADINEYYANSSAILIEAAMTGDQERVRYINEASAKEIKTRVVAFFRHIIKVVTDFIRKIMTALKKKKDELIAWFKSKKKNKDGKEATVDQHVDGMNNVDADPSSAPKLSTWDDDYMNNSASGTFVEMADWLSPETNDVLKVLSDNTGDRSAQADAIVKKYDEKADTLQAATEDAIKEFQQKAKGGTAKDVTNSADIKAMRDVLKSFTPDFIEKQSKMFQSSLKDIERNVMSVVSEYSEDSDVSMQKALNAIQRHVTVFVNSENKLLTAVATAMRERTAEYQRVVDWAVRNSTGA